MERKKLITIIVVVIIALVLIVAAYTLNQVDEKESTEKTSMATTKPFLWKIEKDEGDPSYLYGSIHIGTDEILTLPEIVIEKIDEVDVVYTEVKLDQDTINEAAVLSLIESGEVLDDLLPGYLANRLEAYLLSKNYYWSSIKQFDIWAITISLIQFEYPEYFLKPYLDEYIWDLATEKEKEMDGLESIYVQFDIYENLSIDEQIRMLNDTLNDIEEYAKNDENPLEELANAYLDGELKPVFDLVYEDYDETDPLYSKILQKLLTDRNYNLSENISDIITNNPDKQYFFTIGTAHFYGDDGLIKLLEKKGYTITRENFYECNCEICDNGEEPINGRCYLSYNEED